MITSNKNKLAIHYSEHSFAPKWIEYCEEKNIEFKLVNCFDNNIVDELKDCWGLMWHFHHTIYKDFLIAKGILAALETTGLSVFPNMATSFHFDDKLAQKYLLERINAPIPKTYLFFDSTTASNQVKTMEFPKVFKLRGGAGSNNVKLIKNSNQALSIISKSFGGGFSSYNKTNDLKDTFNKVIKKNNYLDFFKSVRRFFVSTYFSKRRGNEKDYFYLQDFIKEQTFDTRIIVIGNKAFGLTRYVRKGDFRASGSGMISYDKNKINLSCVKAALEISKKLNTQCLAYDFVMNNADPVILEISYGFTPTAYDDCEGFWDENLNWHEGKFNPFGWMVENLVIESKKNEY